jgi:hypothetical protein
MKRIILIIALLLPIGIFLFLKFFGKNEFAIPIYYQDELSAPSDCNNVYQTPYVVPVEILDSLKWRRNNILLVLDSERILEHDLSITLDSYKTDQIELNIIDQSSSLSKKLFRCSLLMEDKWDAVLVDSSKRIRGYYSLTSREEFDRLDVELSILLNKY